MATEIVPRFLLPRLSWAAQIHTSQAARPLSWTIPQGGNAAARWHHSTTTTTTTTTTANARWGSPFPLRRALHKSPVLSRTFHATARRERDHHFDTLKFVKRLQDEGFTEEQSVAMMKVLNDVIQERYVCVTGIMQTLLHPVARKAPYHRQDMGLRMVWFICFVSTFQFVINMTCAASIQNLTRTMVLREDAAKATYTQKVDFAKLRSELLSADSTEVNTTRTAHERLENDIAKLRSRLRDEISRTQASVRLDLNLEKGRIREEAVGQELKIKETETKIEQEVAMLREKLEQVKFQTLQWLLGLCTGLAALMLGAWRVLQ
ncbi:hypothetical protein E4U25_000355 [Claviceps purpurea]|nr:hypothetical protein E4U25_000355 [Claviceps purpurea]